MRYLSIFENYDKQKVLDKELLKYSSKTSALQKMRELIEKGANVNYNDINDGTPLMKAAGSMFYGGIKLLIDNGADVNIVSRRYDTAFLNLASVLDYSVSKRKNNFINIVDLFMENGVDLNAKNSRGFDVIDFFKHITSVDAIKHIKNKFPKQYKEYLIKKDSEKYNI